MWALNMEGLRRLERNEVSMLHLMCNVIVHEWWSTNELREKLGIRGIRCSVHEKRLSWYRHVMNMEGKEVPSDPNGRNLC